MGGANGTTRPGSVSFYSGVKALFYPAGRWYFRMKIEGIENVPSAGPAILAANHVSWLDPPALGSACPRPIRFLIARTVYERRAARWFYGGMRAIPVEPGCANPRGLRIAARALLSGELVGVFPQGLGLARGGARQPAPGALLLAALTRAPFVPVALSGTDRAWPPGRRVPRPRAVRVRFGKPYTPWGTKARPDRAEMSSALDELMSRIRKLGSESVR